MAVVPSLYVTIFFAVTIQNIKKCQLINGKATTHMLLNITLPVFAFFTTFQRMLDRGIPLNIYTSLRKEEVSVPCWMHRITSIIQNAITAESQNKVFSINTNSQLDVVCNLEGKVVVGLLFSHSFLCCGLSAIL